jgi:hypothetical protein
MLIEFTVDCPECDGTATAGVTMFTDHEPGKPLRIDLEMAAAQLKFVCEDDDCGAQCFSGDYEVFTDDE